MPYIITCDACKQRLSIPDDVEDARLTCPRCLAEVTHPARRAAGAIQSAPAPGRQETPAHAAPSPSGENPCPGCGRSLEEGWRLCPYCGEPLRPEAPRPRAARVDTDVRRDSGGVTGGIVLLAILGGIASVLWFLSSLDLVLSSHKVEVGHAAIPGVYFLLLLGVIIFGVFGWEKWRAAPGTSGGIMILRVLSRIGCLALIAIGVWFGILVLFLVSCLVPGLGRRLGLPP